MNFQKLLEPYVENGRTTEGQILWLQKKGFSPVVIEKTIYAVYKMLENGDVFESGNELDQELLRTATDLSKIEAQLLIKNMDRFIEGGRLSKAWKALRGKI